MSAAIYGHLHRTIIPKRLEAFLARPRRYLLELRRPLPSGLEERVTNSFRHSDVPSDEVRGGVEHLCQLVGLSQQ